MKKVLIQCLHRPDRSPSQRFRFEQYIPYLKDNGYEFDFSYLLDAKDDKTFYGNGSYFSKASIVIKSIWKRWREVRKASSYDLVFVQREAFMLGTAYFEKAISKKAPMIFDFDDAIWLHEISDANKRLAFLKDATKTSSIIKPAALVLAGNDFLANYARQFNQSISIVPTTIDTDTYRLTHKKENKGVCIGWSGSFSTIKHFATAIPVLKKLKEKYGDKIYFKIIGDAKYYCEELATQGIAWNGATEIEDLSEIDIGIMPLPDDEWSKGKCGLKGLQYMALNIPTLMTPVGVNTDIVKNDINGYLPKTEEEWVQVLSMLIDNPGKRKEVGDNGRKTVEVEYSVIRWREQYKILFDKTVRKEK